MLLVHGLIVLYGVPLSTSLPGVKSETWHRPHACSSLVAALTFQLLMDRDVTLSEGEYGKTPARDLHEVEWCDIGITRDDDVTPCMQVAGLGCRR